MTRSVGAAFLCLCWCLLLRGQTKAPLAVTHCRQQQLLHQDKSTMHPRLIESGRLLQNSGLKCTLPRLDLAIKSRRLQGKLDVIAKLQACQVSVKTSGKALRLLLGQQSVCPVYCATTLQHYP